jgi:hypothetical protein
MAERALPSAASLPRRLLQSLLPWLCVAVLWELLSRSGLVSARLMPSLVLIAQAFVEELQSGLLMFHAWASLLRALELPGGDEPWARPAPPRSARRGGCSERALRGGAPRRSLTSSAGHRPLGASPPLLPP